MLECAIRSAVWRAFRLCSVPQDEIVRLCTMLNNFNPLYDGNFRAAMEEIKT